MIMKIDTQGMSLDTGKDTGKSIEEQRAAIPDMEVVKTKLFSDSFKKELKDLINEILDEREYQKKLEGPYDFYDDDKIDFI